MEGDLRAGAAEGPHPGPPHAGGPGGRAGLRGGFDPPAAGDADGQAHAALRPGRGGPDHENLPHPHRQVEIFLLGKKYFLYTLNYVLKECSITFNNLTSYYD